MDRSGQLPNLRSSWAGNVSMSLKNWPSDELPNQENNHNRLNIDESAALYIQKNGTKNKRRG